MEDIITRKMIGKTCTRNPMESKMVPKNSIEDKRPQRPVLKCHKCGRTSHLAKTCTKKTKIHEVQVIEEVQDTEEKEESNQDSTISEHTPVEDYPIENITAFLKSLKYILTCHNIVNNAINLSISKIPGCINPSLSPKIKHELIDVLYTYNNSFSSYNQPLGTIRGHEVDITLNIDRPYPPVLRRPAYPESPRAREASEKHIQELIQIGALRKVGHNEEVEVTTPVIIS
ncbi:hypothetical protein O181_033583 [Austropuccinia psidii MF-1]|uniref:CCHC-type domain-containing protein n=1 Tax=Austropuccinia psidii MF-1 TaxID=1389203 RepID=A0A9Q3H6K7_9BASI|nr:hypothetical protein [Austropuccinia psidii MF-1]